MTAAGSRLLAAAVAVAGAPLCVRHTSAPADAVAILGSPLRDGRISDVLEERMEAGVDVYRRGLAPVVCVTGGGRHGPNEADAMAARARQLGVPDSALRIDRAARNTRDNARGVAGLLAPGATVWIVTQPFHLRRSIREFRRAGLRPLGWYIADSVQHRAPRRAARWIAREYLALLRPRFAR